VRSSGICVNVLGSSLYSVGQHRSYPTEARVAQVGVSICGDKSLIKAVSSSLWYDDGGSESSSLVQPI
jgi:hypothetical protein